MRNTGIDYNFYKTRYEYCYKAAGFKDVILDEIETYKILDEEWKCAEMAIER